MTHLEGQEVELLDQAHLLLKRRGMAPRVDDHLEGGTGPLRKVVRRRCDSRLQAGLEALQVAAPAQQLVHALQCARAERCSVLHSSSWHWSDLEQQGVAADPLGLGL